MFVSVFVHSERLPGYLLRMTSPEESSISSKNMWSKVYEFVTGLVRGKKRQKQGHLATEPLPNDLANTSSE